MSATEKAKTEVRKRRPAARRSDIVIALLETRLEMIAEFLDRQPTEPHVVTLEPHVVKMLELFAELKRSMSKNAAESEEV